MGIVNAFGFEIPQTDRKSSVTPLQTIFATFTLVTLVSKNTLELPLCYAIKLRYRNWKRVSVMTPKGTSVSTLSCQDARVPRLMTKPIYDLGRLET